MYYISFQLTMLNNSNRSSYTKFEVLTDVLFESPPQVNVTLVKQSVPHSTQRHTPQDLNLHDRVALHHKFV